ncbi:uncharacterized protein EHS24_005060 [Apiotrichum porosum]|uniref:Uncharacterized protein n=1 Tax=Apiotrichum porosum TaxID=105984 RepID=A0A427Y6S3_9TREE|nr:uncharacterized protein EHS24_005060 [Apiotrichum porosum]RSH86788.1 hypothetical protein EHS24_005060 [Apiotrichum porosum]
MASVHHIPRPAHASPRTTTTTRAAFAAPHALHFAIPILPTPTPPSLLKRQSSSSGSSNASNSARTSPSPRFPETSPPLRFTRARPASAASSGRHSRTSTRRPASSPSSLCASPELPPAPVGTPLDVQPLQLSFPALDANASRPVLVRRDTPRPSSPSPFEPQLPLRDLAPRRPTSLNIEINEFETHFRAIHRDGGMGLGVSV